MGMKMRLEANELLRFLEMKKNTIADIIRKEAIGLYPCFFPGSADSTTKNLISFVGRTAKDPARLCAESKAAVLFVDKEIDYTGIGDKTCLIVTKNARLLFCELLNYMPKDGSDGISPRGANYVDKTATIGKGTVIGYGCVVCSNVRLGEGCIVHHNATILHDVEIGDGVVIGPGAVIGMEGFGYEKGENGRYIRFPHTGKVIIEDNVEIGANAVIDRAVFEETRICSGVKIDNLVHISHNVRIEKNTLVIANAMIGGGTTVGRDSWIGPSASLLDRINVGANVFVGMGASVVDSLPDDARYTLRHMLTLFPKK